MLDPAAYQYVVEMRARGMTAEQIYSALLAAGWTVADIQSAYEHATTKDHGADLQRRVVRLVLGFGATLVGAGAFSFVAANWQSMSAGLRIALIVVSFVTASVAGWWMRDYHGYRFTGEALLLLGNILFGAGIFLVAQVYNTSVEWPTGFLLWMLGTLAVAAAADSTLLRALALITGCFAIGLFPSAIASAAPYESLLKTAPLLTATGAGAAIVTAVMVRARATRIRRDRW